LADTRVDRLITLVAKLVKSVQLGQYLSNVFTQRKLTYWSRFVNFDTMGSVAKRKVDRHESIISAAVRCFARHGYRRTSMDEVAGEAGISRAALYLYFDNKEALFRSLCEDIHDKLIVAAETVIECSGPLETRLSALFEAKASVVFDLLASTEHGCDLLDENNRRCGDVSAACQIRFHTVLVQLLKDAENAGEIELDERGLTPTQAADLILSAVEGIETFGGPDLSPEQYRINVAHMLQILVSGLSQR